MQKSESWRAQNERFSIFQKIKTRRPRRQNQRKCGGVEPDSPDNWLYNGDTMGKFIYLSDIDNGSQFKEITEEERQEILAKEQEDIEKIDNR